jgi:hypothetical protein
VQGVEGRRRVVFELTAMRFQADGRAGQRLQGPVVHVAGDSTPLVSQRDILEPAGAIVVLEDVRDLPRHGGGQDEVVGCRSRLVEDEEPPAERGAVKADRDHARMAKHL